MPYRSNTLRLRLIGRRPSMVLLPDLVSSTGTALMLLIGIFQLPGSLFGDAKRGANEALDVAGRERLQWRLALHGIGRDLLSFAPTNEKLH